MTELDKVLNFRKPSEMKPMQNPVIVALDVSSEVQAMDLARTLVEEVGMFKIGSELFTRAGPSIVKSIRDLNAGVFLDLKFHDIPNTVARSVEAAVALGVDMLTIHCSGGLAMMQAAEMAAMHGAEKAGVQPPLVLGVTVLTNLTGSDLDQLGMHNNVGRQVERLASLAVKAGLRGLVCSPLEITMLRQVLPQEFKLVTPGVRMGKEPADDQRRTLAPRQALDAGADWLVIGRPIYQAEDPLEAVKSIRVSLDLSS